MEIDRPAPGEELNPGEETIPRPAASVILLRGGEETLEVLLVRRNPQARFMGGAWVFPGGSVDRSEGEGQGALRAAATGVPDVTPPSAPASLAPVDGLVTALTEPAFSWTPAGRRLTTHSKPTM